MLYSSPSEYSHESWYGPLPPQKVASASQHSSTSMALKSDEKAFRFRSA